MPVVRCPQEIFDAFAGATEAQKSELRKRVLDWFERQQLGAETIVVMPHPETGEEMILRRLVH